MYQNQLKFRMILAYLQDKINYSIDNRVGHKAFNHQIIIRGILKYSSTTYILTEVAKSISRINIDLA